MRLVVLARLDQRARRDRDRLGALLLGGKNARERVLEREEAGVGGVKPVEDPGRLGAGGNAFERGHDVGGAAGRW